MNEVYLILDGDPDDDTDMRSHDKLFLEFEVDGCFTNDEPTAFRPQLPDNQYFTAGTVDGPYYPKKKNHNVTYDFEPNQQCQQMEERDNKAHEHERAEPEHRKRKIGMHTIHIGN